LTLDERALSHRFLAAAAIAHEAGQIAGRRFRDRSSFTVGFKGPQDYLTEVDLEVERFIATRLHGAFPEDGFIGEEGEGRVGKPGAPTWVVDPIDGTMNFARGAPHFCVSIAAVLDREVEIGAVYDPIVEEMFLARRGAGATVNGAAMSVSKTDDLKSAIVEVGWNMRGGAEYGEAGGVRNREGEKAHQPVHEKNVDRVEKPEAPKPRKGDGLRPSERFQEWRLHRAIPIRHQPPSTSPT